MRTLPPWASLCAFLPAGAALAQDVTVFPLQGPLRDRVAVYRSVSDPGVFYYVPAQARFALSPEGKEAFGVQLYKTGEEAWAAVITLSVGVYLDQDSLKSFESELQSIGAKGVSPAPSSFDASYFLRLPSQAAVQVMPLQSGELVPGAAIAVTFTLEGAASDLRGALAGDATDFGILLELAPNLRLGDSKSITFSGPKFAEKLAELAFLSTWQFREENAPLAYLKAETNVNGVGEELALRNWLLRLLGSPSIHFGKTGEATYGWDLTNGTIAADLKGQPEITILSQAFRGEPDSLAAILTLGNVCARLPEHIANLEDGSVGCSGLE